ncbi:hypothetical protein EJ06DRAFT_584386 [Trichodelitschia bisporula]|uniref:Cenp-O kinetochore centromere component n=1 Tax=Trichodelitschia bisporula TaxID=703511 RepID=A0A6G1HN03_9PEZI|nr:hypothetical protein EJ06DRAFT_584386 [Trichodelitschia bisporula]
MDPIPSDTSSLDAELTALRAEISTLRLRRSLLRTTLLSWPALHTELTASLQLPGASQALTAITAQTETNTANIHRACTGLTLFRVQDPDPNAVDGGEVVGIRIEGFDTGSGRFSVPWFVFLVGQDGEGVRVLRHTLPESVPLAGLEQKYLRRKGGGDLEGFARGVRRECVSLVKRGEMVGVLREWVGTGGGEFGVEGVEGCDEAAREVEVRFEGGDVKRLRLGVDGGIEAVTIPEVVPYKPVRGGRRKISRPVARRYE